MTRRARQAPRAVAPREPEIEPSRRRLASRPVLRLHALRPRFGDRHRFRWVIRMHLIPADVLGDARIGLLGREPDRHGLLDCLAAVETKTLANSFERAQCLSRKAHRDLGRFHTMIIPRYDPGGRPFAPD